ncbi:MAG: DNA topoisomerase, partial [Microgenomates group bacterium]
DQSLTLTAFEDKMNQTNPPPRYNEASLIKILEEKGIGRPSTYAPILSLIQEKHYVEKLNRYLAPTKLGQAISDYLSSSFPDIFDLNFTAKMEDGLDEIAKDKKDMILLLKEFYQPFFSQLQQKKEDSQVINIEEMVDEKCPKCDSPLVIRYSKFGKFLACSQYPKCKFTKPILNLVEGKYCPECAGAIVVRYTKSKKKFYGCSNWPKCGWRSWKLINSKS